MKKSFPMYVTPGTGPILTFRSMIYITFVDVNNALLNAQYVSFNIIIKLFAYENVFLLPPFINSF
jgi:hypothetical protein